MGTTDSRDDEVAARTLGEVLHDGMMPPLQGHVLFLHAHPATLECLAVDVDWHCVQNRRPLADALGAGGYRAWPEPPAMEQRFDGVLVLPPRQREEARASLARAVAHVREGGRVVVAMSNREGARSGERDLRSLIGDIEQISRNKCRVFGGVVEGGRVDREQLQAWLALDAPRPILDGRYVSRPGLFAWDRVDRASALLAGHLPADLSGRVADLGAGYGYLSCEALRRCPGITALDLYEADARALQPARLNLERAQADTGRVVAVQVHWHDVTAGVPAGHDAVICNPPFHVGRADRPDLGQAFIESAAGALRPGGALWMVANRHLPYESTLARYFPSVRAVVEVDGFKVITARLGGAA